MSPRGPRTIPAVSSVLATPDVRAMRERYGEGLVTRLVREILEETRRRLLDGSGRAPGPGEIAAELDRRAREVVGPRPRLVVNATGVVVHTNLGRAPLSPTAARRVAEGLSGYLDLEVDLERGGRGSRMSHLALPMEHLFPGCGFHVVNNNAAAVMLCLHALAAGKEVPISRGELVEIGGSFRVPDILELSGATLREVGTTNRTRASDYSAAIGPRTGAVLKVHRSNFRIVGFTEEPDVEELAELAHGAGLPLVVDWGSGSLLDLAGLGITDERPVAELLERGADLVTFSGDKLLGGPQSGFVVGRREWVERVRRDPLARVCRLDRVLVGALHETLAAYVRGAAWAEVPTLAMISEEPEAIGRRAEGLARRFARDAPPGVEVEIVDGVSRTGGGSSPAGERPTRLVRFVRRGSDGGRVERHLRAEGDPRVLVTVRDGAVLVDLRTVRADEEEPLARRLLEAFAATR